jgi:hypothetical protein
MTHDSYDSKTWACTPSNQRSYEILSIKISHDAYSLIHSSYIFHTHISVLVDMHVALPFHPGHPVFDAFRAWELAEFELCARSWPVTLLSVVSLQIL